MGAGDAGEIALREIKNNSNLEYVPVGFIDDNIQKIGRRIHGVPILGTRKQLGSVVRKHNIEEILVTVPSAEPVTLNEIIIDCQSTGVAVRVMPRSFEVTTGLIGDHLPQSLPDYEQVAGGTADVERKKR